MQMYVGNITLNKLHVPKIYWPKNGHQWCHSALYAELKL